MKAKRVSRLRLIGLREPEAVRILRERVNILEQLVEAKDALNTSKEQMLGRQRTLINDQRVMLERNRVEILRQFHRANRAERLSSLVVPLKEALEYFVRPGNLNPQSPGERLGRVTLEMADRAIAEMKNEEGNDAAAVS